MLPALPCDQTRVGAPSGAIACQAWRRTPSAVVSQRSTTPAGGGETLRSGKKTRRSSDTKGTSAAAARPTARPVSFLGVTPLPTRNRGCEVELGRRKGVIVGRHRVADSLTTRRPDTIPPGDRRGATRPRRPRLLKRREQRHGGERPDVVQRPVRKAHRIRHPVVVSGRR